VVMPPLIFFKEKKKRGAAIINFELIMAKERVGEESQHQVVTAFGVSSKSAARITKPTKLVQFS
jgi:hypothetical protein